jgi:hypothetical protein
VAFATTVAADWRLPLSRGLEILPVMAVRPKLFSCNRGRFIAREGNESRNIVGRIYAFILLFGLGAVCLLMYVLYTV